MKQIKIMMISKKKIKRNLILFITSSFGLYLLISLYFMNHFFLQTVINGVNVSLKSHDDTSDIINNYIQNYQLQLIDRNGDTDIITSQEIGMKLNKGSYVSQVHQLQVPFLWFGSLFHKNQFYMVELYDYSDTLLDKKLDELKFFQGKIVEPKNVDFKYMDGSYEIIKEIYGNKINRGTLENVVNEYLCEGRKRLDIDITNCYENPKYTYESVKTLSTKKQLDQYISTKITYRFGSVTELLDGATLHRWLNVDENLEVVINREEVAKYIKILSKKYDTVGIIREFQSTTGKKVEIQGGLYGWRIDRDAETKALISNIKQADKLEKEPIYRQRAVSREGNEIGNTFIEINISKQHLWFYKDGKLIVQGSIVTGNPNRGNATVLGAYMINYKQRGATLTGPNYEARVTYWMPFFGNIGLHDASWRSRFGGEIYLRNGTHGCVNAPIYLAKTVFENIEEGTPVILYKE